MDNRTDRGPWLIAFARYRWRTLLAGVVGGIATPIALQVGLHVGLSTLIGWDAAATTFLIPTLWMVFGSGSDAVRAHAKLEDENRAVLLSVVLAAVAASFVAVVVALNESKGHGSLAVGLSVATLVLSWIVVQSLYTVHYAHRYFGDRDDDGEPDGGIDFPGEKPSTYRDFVYVAVCVGATCQVSDFDITTTRFRNLVTSHACLSFVFNTMVLALGINIVGNVLGH